MMVNNPYASDCHMICEKEKIYLHKIILSVRCRSLLEVIFQISVFFFFSQFCIQKTLDKNSQFQQNLESCAKTGVSLSLPMITKTQIIDFLQIVYAGFKNHLISSTNPLLKIYPLTQSPTPGSNLKETSSVCSEIPSTSSASPLTSDEDQPIFSRSDISELRGFYKSSKAETCFKTFKNKNPLESEEDPSNQEDLPKPKDLSELEDLPKPEDLSNLEDLPKAEEDPSEKISENSLEEDHLGADLSTVEDDPSSDPSISIDLQMKELEKKFGSQSDYFKLLSPKDIETRVSLRVLSKKFNFISRNQICF